MIFDKTYLGYPIKIATKEIQCRKHKKKRINKKWLKKYGYHEFDIMEHGKVMMASDGVIWMTKKTFQQIKNIMEK